MVVRRPWIDPVAPCCACRLRSISVFAMAVPAHYTHQHLMLLSELAELFSAPCIRQALREAGDARELRQALDLTPPASAA